MPQANQKVFYKNCDYEIKEVGSSGNEGIVEGYASVFNIIDLGDDLIEKGAFKATIKAHKGVWPILQSHDPKLRIGYNKEAKEDDHGLWFREQLAMDVQGGREQFSLTKMAHEFGGKDGISIGYMVEAAKPDEERPMVRRIKRIEMWEHSHVTFGMNQQAMTNATKSWLGSENGEKTLQEYADLFFKHMEFIGHSAEEVSLCLANLGKTPQNSKGQDVIDSLDRAIKILST